MDEEQQLREALERVFAADSAIYQERGFQRRVGFGERPAIVNIDLANAWTRPGHAFSCDHMDVIIPTVQRLNAAARAKGCPIVYTTTAFQVTDGDTSDMGLWNRKIPLEELAIGTEAVAIDDRIAPEPRDQVIVTGVTMAGCVRHTVEDAISEGFRPIIVREAVGDRVPGVVQWNLFDLDAKFGDVEAADRVIEYLEQVAAFESRAGVHAAA